MLQNNIGSSLEDLKYNYSVDLIYSLYEKVKKDELEKNRLQAILLYNSLVATSQSMDQRSATNKQRHWQKFMESLDWRALEKKNKDKNNPEKIKAFFASIGVPVDKDVKK